MRDNERAGSVAEWSIAPVLKTGGSQGPVSSNLTASASAMPRDVDERAPFDEWLAALRDVQARARIRARLARVQAGNFGDFKPLQDGVQELRIDHGPGYRVYLSRQGPVVVLLLCGSDKSGQAAAIKQAVAYLKDWRKRGEP